MKNEARNKRIVKELLQGQTLQSVGLKFGLSRERIRQIAINENPDLYLKQWSYAQDNKILNKRLKEMELCRDLMKYLPISMHQLAREAGYEYHTIGECLRGELHYIGNSGNRTQRKVQFHAVNSIKRIVLETAKNNKKQIELLLNKFNSLDDI